MSGTEMATPEQVPTNSNNIPVAINADDEHYQQVDAADTVMMTGEDPGKIAGVDPKFAKKVAYRTNSGLEISWAGIKHFVWLLGQQRNPLVIIGYPESKLYKEDPDDRELWFWRCTVKVEGKGTGIITVGAKEVPYLKSITDKNTNETKRVRDENAYTACLSKAKRNAYRDHIPEAMILTELEKADDGGIADLRKLNVINREGQKVVNLYDDKAAGVAGLCHKCNTPVVCTKSTYNGEERLSWRNQSNNESHAVSMGKDGNGKTIWACRKEAAPVQAAPKPAQAVPRTLPSAEAAPDGGPPGVVPTDTIDDQIKDLILKQLGGFYGTPQARLDQLRAGPVEALKRYYENVTEGVRLKQEAEAKAATTEVQAPPRGMPPVIDTKGELTDSKVSGMYRQLRDHYGMDQKDLDMLKKPQLKALYIKTTADAERAAEAKAA